MTLSSAVFDAYEGASACSGIADAHQLHHYRDDSPATITVNAGSTPGFCHYTVTGSDGTATQTQGGWIVVGNPPATLAQSGNNQSGTAGTALSQPLTVTLDSRPVRRLGQRRGHSIHHLGRHALQRHHNQRSQRDCPNQLLGRSLGHTDAAFVQGNCDGHRAGSVRAGRSFRHLHGNGELMPHRFMCDSMALFCAMESPS